MYRLGAGSGFGTKNAITEVAHFISNNSPERLGNYFRTGAFAGQVGLGYEIGRKAVFEFETALFVKVPLDGVIVPIGDGLQKILVEIRAKFDRMTFWIGVEVGGRRSVNAAPVFNRQIRIRTSAVRSTMRFRGSTQKVG